MGSVFDRFLAKRALLKYKFCTLIHKNKELAAISGVVTVLIVKYIVINDEKQCSLVEICRHFGRTNCLLLQNI